MCAFSYKLKFQKGFCKMATSRKTSGNWEISVSSPTHLEVQLQLQTIEKLLLRNLWSCPSTKWWPASNSASQHDLIYIAGRSHPYGYKPQIVSSTCQVSFFITLIPTHHWKFLSFKNHQVGYSELSGLCFLPVGKFGHQIQTIFLPPGKQKTVKLAILNFFSRHGLYFHHTKNQPPLRPPSTFSEHWLFLTEKQASTFVHFLFISEPYGTP